MCHFSFYSFLYKFFDRIKRVIDAEKFIWSRFGYGGTLDNVSELIDTSIIIIDYKNARKPKIDAWIEEYFTQVSGYAMAYYERTGKICNTAEIWIANELDDKPQIFKMTSDDIKHYYIEFRKRLNVFNNKFKTI
mgnify:CR=1 FL=1